MNTLTKLALGLMGQVNDLTTTAVACEFNDLAGVEAALQKGDVAAILTEPVMTNSCMVLPEAGFHDGLRQLARQSLSSLATRGVVRPEFIRALLEQRLPEHPGYYGEMVWILMMLEQWLQAKSSRAVLH